MFRGGATLAVALGQREAYSYHGSFSECLDDRQFRPQHGKLYQQLTSLC
jgi:S-formylglutathione hydrolase FrmB